MPLEKQLHIKSCDYAPKETDNARVDQMCQGFNFIVHISIQIDLEGSSAQELHCHSLVPRPKDAANHCPKSAFSQKFPCSEANVLLVIRGPRGPCACGHGPKSWGSAAVTLGIARWHLLWHLLWHCSLALLVGIARWHCSQERGTLALLANG